MERVEWVQKGIVLLVDGDTIVEENIAASTLESSEYIRVKAVRIASSTVDDTCFTF
jgi:hypothetical protein